MIKDWLFRRERADLDRLKTEYEGKLAGMELHAQSLDETAIVRQKLEGFDPNLLDAADSIEEQERQDDNLDAFLSEVHTIAQTAAFTRLLDYLIREQVLHTAKWADTLEKANFGRASINGIALVREEVRRLDGMYRDRNKPKEEFDEHAVV